MKPHAELGVSNSQGRVIENVLGYHAQGRRRAGENKKAGDEIQAWTTRGWESNLHKCV